MKLIFLRTYSNLQEPRAKITPTQELLVLSACRSSSIVLAQAMVNDKEIIHFNGARDAISCWNESARINISARSNAAVRREAVLIGPNQFPRCMLIRAFCNYRQ